MQTTKCFMWLFLLVLPSAVLSATTPTLDDLCEPVTRAGVNMKSFSKSVAHGVHSLSVEDIRYFFDEQFPISNSVPTVNLNLTGSSYVVPYVPSRPSVFKFPGGAAFDFILNNNDQTDKFGSRGETNLEEIAHQMHMMEMWHHASKMYKDIATKHINTEQVCPCLVDEQKNGIIDELVNISKWLKNLLPVPIVEGVRRIPRALALNGWNHGYSVYTRDDHSLSKRDTEEIEKLPVWIEDEEFQIIPELKDSKSWNMWWKPTFVGSKNDLNSKEAKRQDMHNFAMYMYCKINM